MAHASAARGGDPASDADFVALLAAGSLLTSVLDRAESIAAPGVTTLNISLQVDRWIRSAGGVPTLAQPGRGPFPGAACVTINEQVFGAPPGERVLAEGDLVTIDVALSRAGWHVDAARPIVVGESTRADPRRAHLAAAARAVVLATVGALQAERPWSQAARVGLACAADFGVRVVPGFDGHGTGRLAYRRPRVSFCTDFAHAPGGLGEGGGQDFIVRRGMVFTIEPVVTPGSGETIELDDGWTVATADGAPACSCEMTVAITPAGPRVVAG